MLAEASDNIFATPRGQQILNDIRSLTPRQNNKKRGLPIVQAIRDLRTEMGHDPMPERKPGGISWLTWLDDDGLPVLNEEYTGAVFQRFELFEKKCKA